ncbi:DNA-directed RNA polymerase subunit delta [Alicyclobacillaceae bacterium I2511]|nr:DNA-directed RNA polymerase subunit delta [Alicyclobacillaceae bacterium I2511]
MTVNIPGEPEEIAQMPLVELAFEILKERKEPHYFRDIMQEIQTMRGMSEQQVTDIIARLYTEINIDGRFVCVGQNVWALKRWYPVDKTGEKAGTSRRFVRSTGDAFSDDDEDLDDYDVDAEDDLNEEPIEIIDVVAAEDDSLDDEYTDPVEEDADEVDGLHEDAPEDEADLEETEEEFADDEEEDDE